MDGSETERWRLDRAHLVAAAVPGAIAFVIYCVFSITRHTRFGSGSWDMGCHVHNLWLLSHAKPLTSTVLGDVNVFGDHFMPALVLAAPLAYTHMTSSLLLLQALLVAAAVLPLALLAQRREVGPFATAAICVAFLFAVGTQSFIEFDVHETAPVPLLLFVALLAFDTPSTAPLTRRARIAGYVALIVMAGCKESAILYAAVVGVWIALTQRGRARRIEGAAICVGFVAWFVVVTSAIQPALLEPGATMTHLARFKELGASPGEIAASIVTHPLHTIGMLFAPAPKAATLAVTTGGFAFLPLLSPQALLLAAPNWAERFLSDKREMWGLGFHYSLVLVACCAFGSVDALARVRRFVFPRLVARPIVFDAVAAVVVVAACALSNVASPVTPDFATLQKPYMATDDQVERYRRAIAVVPDDAKVAAQNHFLPHLAFRQFIWQPQLRFVDKADWVVLDEKASPWPDTPRYVALLVDRLRADPAWAIAFEDGSTIVFRRR